LCLNATAVKNKRGCKFCPKSFVTFAEVKESQNYESLVADKYELIKDNNGNNNEVADRT
jgi:transcriptional regulator NrdR family protein